MHRETRASSSGLAASWILALAVVAGLTLTGSRAETSPCPEANQPTFRAEIGFPSQVFEVSLDGNWICALRRLLEWTGNSYTYNNTLSIHDLSSPTPEVAVGSMALFFDTRGFAVEDGYAYLVDPEEFHVVDVSDPANPHEVGYSGGWPMNPGCMAVAVGRAYVGDGAGLQIVDVADPSSPSRLGSLALSANAVSVALGGALAYVGTLDGRMSVVDVSDPDSPVIQATLQLPGTPWDIEIQGAHAYVADGESGLMVLDISRPARPQLVGSTDAPGDAQRVSVRGARAYVVDSGALASDWWSGLRVYDISNPAHPTIVNSIPKRDVCAVDANESRVAFGGGRPALFDCAGWGCPPVSYLEVARVAAYEPPAPCASHAAAPSSATARVNAPDASPVAGFGFTGGGPNPFNPETSIAFSVPRASRVRVRVYDARGMLVRTLVDDALPSGRHQVAWRGQNNRGEAVGSGIYIVTMEAEGFRQTHKITLLK